MSDNIRRTLEKLAESSGGALSTNRNSLLGQAFAGHSGPALQKMTPGMLGSSGRTMLGGGIATPMPAHFGLTPAYAYPPAIAQGLPQWSYVRRRFTRFLTNLELTELQKSDGLIKQAGIRDTLNKFYYNKSSETANSLLIGSWGKGTQVRPPRDVDVLFLLPAAEYHRYEQRTGNKQSQLLQDVKRVLENPYSTTDLIGDRHVVVMKFASTTAEVAVGFMFNDGIIRVCDTKNGGSYIRNTAQDELAALNSSDTTYSGNTRALIKMMKVWQNEKNVPLKSFVLERLAVEFMHAWEHHFNDVFYYDWMIRDFYAFLYHKSNGFVTMPGTGEVIALGSDWEFKVKTAYGHASVACDHERANNSIAAGEHWKSIFGSMISLGAL